MVDLGVGKNMVRAIRFWALASGMIEPAKKGGGYVVTPLGSAILAEKGADPFLEDIRTLWLLHWKLSTSVPPLLAWDYLLNRWQDPTLTSSLAVDILAKEAAREDKHLSQVTLQQHFETFLHTYIPTRGRKGEVQEDNLDSPLVELELLVKAGEREIDTGGRREALYAFRREDKLDITPELFAYSVADFWMRRHAVEETLPLKSVAIGHGSPGQIFKIPEEDIRTRLTTLDRDSRGAMSFSDASNLQQLRRSPELDSADFLDVIYSLEGADV
jgi:hypothetical protein